MVAKFFLRRRVSIALSCCVFALCAAPILSNRGHAQSSKIILISDESSTRAVAVHSVTLQREPFNPTSPMSWGSDNRTRIMLFAVNLELLSGETASSITVRGTDPRGQSYDLPLEQVGKFANLTGLSSLIVRLPDDATINGDLAINVSLHGAVSNTVLVAIKAP